MTLRLPRQFGRAQFSARLPQHLHAACQGEQRHNRGDDQVRERAPGAEHAERRQRERCAKAAQHEEERGHQGGDEVSRELKILDRVERSP